jgi:hypothetical protein
MIEPTTETFWVESHSQPDRQGRSSFTLYFYDPKTLQEGGPTAHVRSQEYHAALEEVTSRHADARFVEDDRAAFAQWQAKMANPNYREPYNMGYLGISDEDAEVLLEREDDRGMGY